MEDFEESSWLCRVAPCCVDVVEETEQGSFPFVLCAGRRARGEQDIYLTTLSMVAFIARTGRKRANAAKSII